MGGIAKEMLIKDLTKATSRNRARIEASVQWEDCARPTQELYFETSEIFSEDLTCSPNAFVVGCAIPALHHGEKRLRIEGEICPELKEGVTTAMSWLCHWFYPGRRPVLIEGETTRGTYDTGKTRRAGFFFSGGIDSFATLRANRLNFPLEHPHSIKDGLLVYGFEMDDPRAFDCVLQFYSGVAEDIGITIIPVYTNIYLEYRSDDAISNFSFWNERFEGAALAAVAHAFARRFSVVSIAGGRDIAHLGCSGTHPLLDPNYGSAELRILHDDLRHSRLEKTRLVAGWDAAVQNLRVCPMAEHYSIERLNCGRCPKCVKTMLGLLAAGALERTRAFPEKDVSAELILRRALIYDPYSESSYAELLGPLSGIGRHDLVCAIRKKIEQYHYREPEWRRGIKNIDGRFLNGSIRRLYSYLRAMPFSHRDSLSA